MAESARQKRITGRVMHEFKHGELKSGPGGKGGPVKSRRQAIAIALEEAGASKYESDRRNRRNLRRTERKEARGRTGQQEREGASRIGASGKRESTRSIGGQNAKKRTARGRKAAMARAQRADRHTRQELYTRAKRQRIGRDAAGRSQYRYHSDWQKVRETRKARRLVRLAQVLPSIRRSIVQHLAKSELTREFAYAAVIELIARSAIRPGNDSYARLHGTHGETTLLKSHVTNKKVQKEVDARRLAGALALLRELPGRRLFQYRDDLGAVHPVRSSDVNRFLREMAGVKISLKDFRTLLASAAALETLARTQPATSARARRKQVLEAMRATAEDLHNTPAICRKSYVHEAIVTAFEDGILERFADALKNGEDIRSRP